MAITINGTTGIAGVDGSASTPAYQGADTNTGIAFPAADTVSVATGGTERMRIDSSGNVGIGTSSPSGRNAGNKVLQVASSTETELKISTSGNSHTWFAMQPGAGGNNAYISNLDTAGSMIFTVGGYTTERMRIDSSGNFMVGATSAGAKFHLRYDGNATVGQVCDDTYASAGTNKAIQFKRNNSEVGTIGVTTTSTAYNTSSDYRLKDNVAPMTGALATVAALKPCTYTWKIDGSAGQGFIAHELQAVVPDCVTGEKDAVEIYTDEEGVEQTRPVYQGVDTSFLVATLTAAIQELKAIADTQAQTIESLTARIEALEASNV